MHSLLKEYITKIINENRNVPWGETSMRERQVHAVQHSLRRQHPDWTDDRISAVALIVASKYWTKHHR